MLTAEPVDLRGRRALAKSLEKEERHATDQLKQALKASNAAVDELRAVGSELEDEAERVSERAKKDRARVDDVEAQCAYAKARRAELDRLSKRGAREALIKEKKAAEKRCDEAKAQQLQAENDRDAARRKAAEDAKAARDAEALSAALDAEALDSRRLASACALARGAQAARVDRRAERRSMKEARRRALEGPLAAFDRKRRANALRRFITTWARAATQEKGLRRLQARAFRGRVRRYLRAWRRGAITNALADVDRGRRRRRRGLRALAQNARAAKAARAAREAALKARTAREAAARRRQAFEQWQAAALDRRLHAVARAWHRGRMRALAPAADAHASPAAKETMERVPVTPVALRLPPPTPAARPPAPAVPPSPPVPPPPRVTDAAAAAFAARRSLKRGLGTWRAVRLARAAARRLDGVLMDRAQSSMKARSLRTWAARAVQYKRHRLTDVAGPDRLLRLRARVLLRKWRTRAHCRARAAARVERCAAAARRAVVGRALLAWGRAAAAKCQEKEALLVVEAEALLAVRRQRERELDACGPAPWADSERRAHAARGVLEEAGRDVEARRAAVATAVERRRSHLERIAAAEADRVSQEARLQASTAAKDALSAVAACLASRDARLKRAAAEKRKTTEVSIRQLEGTCASLTHQASDAERRARQAELQASKRAEDDASSLQRAVAVASDLSQLLREAEAKEEASKKDVEALDHAAARLRARLEAAEKAAAEAKHRDADVRRRYCDTAELQAALASEKARTHRRLAGRVKALAAADEVLPPRERVNLAAALKRKRDRLLAAAARAAASSDSESTCSPEQFGAAFGSGAPSPASAGAASPAASDATLTMSSSGDDAARASPAAESDAVSSPGSAAAADSSPGAADESGDASAVDADEQPAPSQDGSESAAPSLLA